MISKQSAQDRYVTEITAISASQAVTPHRATGNAAGYERRTHYLSVQKAATLTTTPPSHHKHTAIGYLIVASPT